ncbi:MAG TPA: hypothetical protein VK177_08165 [Flavobacteriales bacterium]|nr:hypothetical protein [Flavobacteriales bacterium]
MSESVEKSGLFERIAHGYFYGDGDDQYIANEYTNQLSNEQNRELRKIRNQTLLYSAIAGTLGVLLLYLPPHFFPGVFALWTVKCTLFSYSFDLPIFATIYGVVLAIAEIYYLVFLNIRSVYKMAMACNFPPRQDPNHNMHIKSLVNIGVEKNAKNELSIGLNPWQGYSKFTVFMIFLWTKLRATLSNMLFKMLLRRIFGRYAIRVLVEIGGVPIMAGFNMYAANKVLKQARVRILSPGFIQQTVMHLHKKYHNDPRFVDLIYDTLQFLAVRKRSFHENHYLLSVNLLKTFNVPLKNTHDVPEDFVEKLKALPEEIQDDIAHLIIIGMIVDGKLTYLERKSLDQMSEAGIIEYNSEEVNQIMHAFINGRGKEMLDQKLKMTV